MHALHPLHSHYADARELDTEHPLHPFRTFDEAVLARRREPLSELDPGVLHPLRVGDTLHPSMAPGDAGRMTTSELAYFTDAPLAHVTAYEDFIRSQRFESFRTRAFERFGMRPVVEILDSEHG